MNDTPILPTADEAIEHFTQPDSPYDAFAWALVNEAQRLQAIVDRVHTFAEERPWTGLGDAFNYEGYETLLNDLGDAATDA